MHDPGSPMQKYTQPGKRNLADLCRCSGQFTQPRKSLLADLCTTETRCQTRRRTRSLSLAASKWSNGQRDTGWHIRLSKTSRWHQNKSFVLAWPGLTWTGQNWTFVFQGEVLLNLMCHPVEIERDGGQKQNFHYSLRSADHPHLSWVSSGLEQTELKRSAKVFFLGCVTCPLGHEGIHATYEKRLKPVFVVGETSK